MKRNLRLLIQFDGTGFVGFQRQAKGRTVQAVLEEALYELSGERVRVYTSSRTDSGVHALEMPVGFKTESTIPLRAYVLGLNSLLPCDVKVLEAREMPDDFHVRFSAKGKTYVYKVQTGPVPLPLWRLYSWHVRYSLDVQAMRDASQFLVGEHDFSSFRAALCDSKSPIREVFGIEVREAADGLLEFWVHGSGFLHNMVRIMVGTRVEVGKGKREPSWVRDVLEARDRTVAGPTAPAKGLHLVKVYYPDDVETCNGPRWPPPEGSQP